MHPAGFEPAVSQWEADYESDAFGHLATDAENGAGGIWTHVHLDLKSYRLLALKTGWKNSLQKCASFI